ncbi:MAG: aminoacyltransferase [Butyrivibrio sp.]|nr:aminoacyltransferase [Butyrivibrio sp.]
MPTFNERLKTQNRKLAEKQKQLDKLNKTVETARESIKVINREIGEIKDEISALETRILTEAISQRGISVAELAAAIETGTFIPEKPPDSKSSTENSTDKTLTEKEVTDEVSGSGKALGGS